MFHQKVSSYFSNIWDFVWGGEVKTKRQPSKLQNVWKERFFLAKHFDILFYFFKWHLSWSLYYLSYLESFLWEILRLHAFYIVYYQWHCVKWSLFVIFLIHFCRRNQNILLWFYSPALWTFEMDLNPLF